MRLKEQKVEPSFSCVALNRIEFIDTNKRTYRTSGRRPIYPHPPCIILGVPEVTESHTVNLRICIGEVT